VSALRRLVFLISLAFLLVCPIESAAAQEPTEVPSVPQVHIVQPGENLFRIALRYGVSVEAIQATNGLADQSLISVGQTLVIPPSGDTITFPTTIEVTFGDSLASIAARHGLLQDTLATTNLIMNPVQVYAGQQLILPESSRSATNTQTQVIYPVQNETPLRLAHRTGQNLAAILLLNHLEHLHAQLSGRPLAILAQGASNVPALSQLPWPWQTITLHPLPLQNGHTGGLHVETTIPGTLRVVFMGDELRVVSDGPTHEALIGLHRYTTPGLYPLSLTLEDPDGIAWPFIQNVRIVEGDYTAENLNLTPEVSTLLDPELVREEYLFVSSIMSGFTEEQYWSSLFLLPTVDDVTSGYGTIRSYNNGPPSSYHAGVDFGGPVGTPIYAPANGVVVEARPLEVRGNVILVDHGMGVYSGFFHLSEILVEPDQAVAAGQEIGRMGSTGLSTASHLHWEMWVNGVQVDPLQWVREPFP
jgi:murein DD-endopeptidase MepM/ murein hydrolase activator NlpD